MHAIRFGVDLAKSVIQVHGVAASGEVVVRRQLRRGQVLAFFARQPPALIGLEACGSAHYWGRELIKLGHEVRLMPPAYVKAYLKRGKTDARDAEAICEAVGRPTMRFVPVKTVEQQCDRALHKARDLLVRQRTQLGNALRGLLYEIGVTAAKGEGGLALLIGRVEARGADIPEAMLAALTPLAGRWRALDQEAQALEKRIARLALQDERSRRLMTIPGVGPLGAHAVIAAIGDGAQFRSGRDLAAWVGLTRRNFETGGKPSGANLTFRTHPRGSERTTRL